MLYLLLATLVATAAGFPRSKGPQVHNTFIGQSGALPQYRQNTANTGGSSHIVPVALSQKPSPQASGAVFSINPNTLQPVKITGNQVAATQQASPNRLNVPQTLQGQQTFQNPQSVGQPSQAQQNFQAQQNLFAQQNFQAQPNFQAQQNSPVNQNVQANPALQGNFQNQPASFQNQGQSNNQFAARPQVQLGQQNNQYQQRPSVNTGGKTTLSANRPNVRAGVELAKRLIGNPPGGALLVGTNPPLFPIEQRLISNYTKLRPFVADTFRCNAQQPNYVGYGYYADVDNDCQIFHICLPWKELFPNTFDEEVTYQFSFICPNQTVFSQDSMTCTWESDALPCAASPELYWLNNNFFRKIPSEDGIGTEYAKLNSPIVHPIVTDYDDFNDVNP